MKQHSRIIKNDDDDDDDHVTLAYSQVFHDHVNIFTISHILAQYFNDLAQYFHDQSETYIKV